jgi:hypothetical protein
MSNENWKTEGLPWVLANGPSGKKLTVILPEDGSKTVSSKDENYERVLAAIKEKRWEDVPDLICPKRRILNFSQGKFEVKNDQVFINGVALPTALSNKIVEYSKEDLPYEPLLAFWENLNQNPSHRSVQQLYGFLEKHDHPITVDGCFIAYKKVRSDFMDCHTGTFSNKVGETVSMPRNQVNEDPNQTCSHGLHVAAFNYAQSFSGEILLMVKVSPKDVVSIPVDYNHEKMRVCQYVVLDVVDKELKAQLLHDTVKSDTDPSELKVDASDDSDLDEEYES